ncbi:Hypothetical protein Minf_2019 [Methylacidiphilum infernorum V4]|uniref:Uncharacterized protein n=1 Tax=Methylacidiphilum infernorum (isolate V4) TaxID=481448 RepID=B3DYM5_METI4|nr:Hypothetical protein Minf_2019 [Methylacidiphilum infernorum V4]
MVLSNEKENYKQEKKRKKNILIANFTLLTKRLYDFPHPVVQAAD